MSQYLRTNEEKKRGAVDAQRESMFAQEVLQKLGGSSVYIEPKKAKKFIDTEKIE